MRWMKRIVATVSLALLLAAVALAWVASTERALTWLAQSAAEWTGGRLELEAPQGSLLGPLTFGRVRYRDPGTAVDVRGVALDWRPSALIAGRISVKTLTAARADVTLQPGTGPARLPESLALPAAVAIDHARIANLRIESGDTVVEHLDVSLAFRGNARRSRIEGLAIIAPAGKVDASLELGAAHPFKLSGTATIGTDYAGHPVRLDIRMDGTLERIRAALDAQAAGAKAAGTIEIEPLAPQPVAAIELDASGVDLAKWAPAAPQSDITLGITGKRNDAAGLSGKARAENQAPGLSADNRLPLRVLEGDFTLSGTSLALRALAVDLGPAGRATGSADVTRDKARLQLAVTALNLKALHRPLHATRLAGTLSAEILADQQRVEARLAQDTARIEARATLRAETLSVEHLTATLGRAALKASGRIRLSGRQEFKAQARFSGVDPSALGEYPAARLSGDLEASGRLRPHWLVDLRIAALGGNWRGAALGGGGRITLSPEHVTADKLELRVGNNRLRANGAFGASQDRLDYAINAGNVAQLHQDFGGALQAEGTLYGTREQAGASAKFSGKGVVFAKSARVENFKGSIAVSHDADRRIDLAASAEGITVQGMKLSRVEAQTRGTLARHEAVVNARSGAHALAARLAGHWQATAGWSGTLESLDVRGPVPVTLKKPAELEFAADRFILRAAMFDVSGGNVRLDQVRWEAARLTSRGAFTALPVKPLLALGAVTSDLDTTLRLRGEWQIDATPRLNGRISIARESGDILFSREPAIAAQLSALTLEATLREDHLTGQLALAAERLGRATAAVEVLPAPGAAAGTVTGDAPLQLDVKADIATLRPFNALFGTAALIDGRLALNLRGTGTLAQPRLIGTIAGDAMRIEVPLHGVYLRDGKLAAELTPTGLVLKEFALRGGEGRIEASGEIPLAETQEARIKWRAEQLRLLARPDRKLVVDGEGTLALLGRRLTARGEVRAREGNIEFAYRQGTELGDDVVVLGREKAPAGKPPAVIDADITLDFGNRFHIHGQGLDTGLEGRIRVFTAKAGELASTGEVRAVHGTYTFLGQRLTIDRGRLIFQGPPHNPGLDVRALRKLPQVEVGVELSGTVRAPQVSLTSNPPMSQGEQMAWLVLGHDLSSTSAADAALLQAAASALGSSSTDAVPITRRFAEAFGVDDISMQGAKTQAGEGQVVAVGKRLSDRVYATIEQGLNVAKSLFRLEFVVNRSVSLRIESGTVDGVPITGAGVVYGRSFD